MADTLTNTGFRDRSHPVNVHLPDHSFIRPVPANHRGRVNDHIRGANSRKGLLDRGLVRQINKMFRMTSVGDDEPESPGPNRSGHAQGPARH